jgi:hypothetical protein
MVWHADADSSSGTNSSNLSNSSISTKEVNDADDIPELLPRDYDTDLEEEEDNFNPPEGFIESEDDDDANDEEG